MYADRFAVIVVGSILSNLRKRSSLLPWRSGNPHRSDVVLVLGMCFFAGGTRFSEQGFGVSAYLLSCSSATCIQLADTLLSVSVPCLDRRYAAQFVALDHLRDCCPHPGRIPLFRGRRDQGPPGSARYSGCQPRGTLLQVRALCVWTLIHLCTHTDGYHPLIRCVMCALRSD